MRSVTISARIVDPDRPSSVSACARANRWAKFMELFPGIDSMSVLDLGGTPHYWVNAPVKPGSVTVVNLESFEPHELVESIVGDACYPPSSITARSYDLVVSNSLIEHVGGHRRRMELAQSVLRLAPRYWVQTPYRYFPIEPHWLFPAFQLLPFSMRVQITRYWRLGHRFAADVQIATRYVSEVELIGRAQMAELFPGSNIWMERWRGLPKSMVAYAA